MSFFRPNLRIRKLCELDIMQLKAKGIRAVGLDKDNVLTLPDELALHVSVKLPIRLLQEHFELAVFSNSVGSNKDFKPHENRFIESVPIVEHGTRKPFGGSILIDHFRNRLGHQLYPSQIAFVGDRILTDILFANINKFYSILIKPLDSTKDSRGVQLVRKFENFFKIYF